MTSRHGGKRDRLRYIEFSREWSSTCMGQLSPEWLAPLAKECGMNSCRTPEQIQKQLEARYAEMEMQAKSALTDCRACRWCCRDSFWGNSPQWKKYDRCSNPLVVGFEVLGRSTQFRDQNLRLCGPEKALWEPKLTRWQKFMEWMHRIIDRLEAHLH